MIAEAIASALADAGYVVVGPAGRLSEAVALATGTALSAALLDIQLEKGMYVYPVANILAERQIPFAFVSSHPPEQIDEAYRDRPHFRKPFQPEALVGFLADLLGEPQSVAQG